MDDTLLSLIREHRETVTLHLANYLKKPEGGRDSTLRAACIEALVGTTQRYHGQSQTERLARYVLRELDAADHMLVVKILDQE